MSEITFQEQTDAQQRIIDYKAEITRIISYSDKNGHRKIKPEHFLSGEVAAYKLLSSWEKRMIQGESIIDTKVLEILDDVEILIDRSTQGDFLSDEAVFDYEFASTGLWMALLSNKDLMPDCEFNRSLVALAAVIEKETGISDEDNQFLKYEGADLIDGRAIAVAYSTVHQWLMEQSQEQVVQWMEETGLHRSHFHAL